jgi:hypothetical protein
MARGACIGIFVVRPVVCLGNAPNAPPPGQIADSLLNRLATLGFAELLAVRRHPSESDRLGDVVRLNLPEVVPKMPSRRMI